METMELPSDPEPNLAIEGTIDHVGDRFRVVFNDQIDEGGGLTVKAVHIYLCHPVTSAIRRLSYIHRPTRGTETKR